MDAKQAIARIRKAVQRIRAAREAHAALRKRNDLVQEVEWGLAFSEVCATEDKLGRADKPIEAILAYVDTLESRIAAHERLEAIILNHHGKLWANYVYVDSKTSVDLMATDLIATRKEREALETALIDWVIPACERPDFHGGPDEAKALEFLRSRREQLAAAKVPA